MTRTPETSNGQPSLADLMVRFLSTRSDASAGAVESVAEGEVEPFEVAAGFRVDPRAAWMDAAAYNPGVATPGTPAVPLPTEWSNLVSQPATAFAVAMAAGNFPQRVRDFQPLLTKFDPAELRPSLSQTPIPTLSGMRTWIAREANSGKHEAKILAAGVARVIGEFDWASAILGETDAGCSDAVRTVLENERAAMLWHRGQCREALAAWDAMTDTPAVLFNRGMANLFLGNSATAKSLLTRAIDTIPESSGWNALARLYLAVAEIHG